MADSAKIFDSSATAEERLDTLRNLKLPEFETGNWVNNHIHTTYSFSPYTPTAAVLMAKQAGLCTAGIVDHDTLAGAEEFIEAGKILGIPTTVGFECRVSMKDTPFEGKYLNNPDQQSLAYFAVHSVPHHNIPMVEATLDRVRRKRNKRNHQMSDVISSLFEPYGFSLDFIKDVVHASMYEQGGAITERHLLYAIIKKIDNAGTTREQMCKLITDLTGRMDEKTRTKIMEAPDEYYLYDVLGIFKAKLMKYFYIPATEELIHITEVEKLAAKAGAISAYAYLGDVAESPTGDKPAQKFEDDFVEELFEYLRGIGVDAITYMPSRNTRAQLELVMRLCKQYGFFQISGEDVNSPRQSFTCPAMLHYPHLFDATYALIGNEIYADGDTDKAMFSSAMSKKFALLDERIDFYSKIGKGE